MIKGRPAGHRVQLEVDSLESVSKGGIVLAHDKRKFDAVETGIVVKLGMNAFKAFDDGQPWCEVGDRVLFPRYIGRRFYDAQDKKHYAIMNDDDIWFVLDKDDEIE